MSFGDYIMFTSATKAFGLALAIGTASLLAGASSASASSFLAGANAPATSNSQSAADIQLVGHRRHAGGGGYKSRRRASGGRYKTRRHAGVHKGRKYRGRRYRNRRSGYRHYHGGYWYPYAWWLGSAAVGVAIASQYDGYNRGGDDAHVEWCLDRYRSYNPRTDAFLAYSGRYKQCISPYSY